MQGRHHEFFPRRDHSVLLDEGVQLLLNRDGFEAKGGPGKATALGAHRADRQAG
ncbi:hypothetical protein [Streptomyces sp. NPDC056690]|uniref:hypothetical protein n=1 Tax=unclassified Streptomyces TaxID=2593676 RepID=UPI003634181F